MEGLTDPPQPAELKDPPPPPEEPKRSTVVHPSQKAKGKENESIGFSKGRGSKQGKSQRITYWKATW